MAACRAQVTVIINIGALLLIVYSTTADRTIQQTVITQEEVNVQEKHFAQLRKPTYGSNRGPDSERQKVWLRQSVARANFARYGDDGDAALGLDHHRFYTAPSEAAGMFNPGDRVRPFRLPTLAGLVRYPGPVMNATSSVLLHVYNKHSAFLQCLWNCSGSVEALLLHSPHNTHYIFMSQGEEAYSDALWMRQRFRQVVSELAWQHRMKSLLARLHFVTLPTYQLGNWIPAVFKQWMCMGHNCGLDQAVFSGQGAAPIVLPRLDARYDWLPLFPLNKSFTFINAHTGCEKLVDVKDKVALVNGMGCSYFQKIEKMATSGAVGVVIVQGETRAPLDMNCNSTEQCSTSLSIHATMVTANHRLLLMSDGKVIFQNTPADNFFYGIDAEGHLAEAGWFLYPSFHFLAWQAQWMNYRQKLEQRLTTNVSLLVPVFNNTLMQGRVGAVAKVQLPDRPWRLYKKMELDMALSCPGTQDTTCAHWDHTVQLFVCCNHSSPLCGAELGRWISPFRRRVGRWLTDVTALMPLLDSPKCTFTMKTVPWAMPWQPSLNLRFSGARQGGELTPTKAYPLYQPGFTFDQKYNTHFPPLSFTVSSSIDKLKIVAVITGHGSDENGCGEFCVTSHHFAVNGDTPHVKTFTNAGTPLGCADRVPEGVEPNEHGTWLYGRDGWCDGQQVDPWVIDITQSLHRKSAVNTLKYYGWFNGTDPNPHQSPGTIIFYSYLVTYTKNPQD